MRLRRGKWDWPAPSPNLASVLVPRHSTLIREGKVTLNGARPTNPSTPVRLGIDRIQVEGRRIAAAEKLYLVLNKPRGMVTTASDEKSRDTVYSLLPKYLQWLAPVGRLDKASEGLLILTNDSEWAARITDPATHLDKTYHVQINAIAGEPLIDSLLRGIETAKGETLRAKRVSLLRSGRKEFLGRNGLGRGQEPTDSPHVRRPRHRCPSPDPRRHRPLATWRSPQGSHKHLTSDQRALLDRAMGNPHA